MDVSFSPQCCLVCSAVFPDQKLNPDVGISCCTRKKESTSKSGEASGCVEVLNSPMDKYRERVF